MHKETRRAFVGVRSNDPMEIEEPRFPITMEEAGFAKAIRLRKY